ncbi:MAG: protein kinase [Myxococcaceae bacterium]|nr:protein kinase [Myxococcaceae bacterium]
MPACSPTMTELLELAPGTRIADRFTVETLAGRGGMGAVYRAVDSLSGQRVALKLLHAVTSPEAAYRFNREAVLLAELHHPAIVSYVAHGRTQHGQPFLAMAWLEGEDLAQRLRSRPLRLAEILSLVRRVAEGLAFAHQQEIVHRDIKPSNLFLRAGRPEDVLLLDFGLARYALPTLVGVTRNHGAIGTPGYMAPEQASNQPEISPSADIFSLGCVLYECLTGQSPFAARHFAAAVEKILFSTPTPLHKLRAGLPPGLQVLVDRMLDKDPRRRLPDATSLLATLSALESIPDLLLPGSREKAPGPDKLEAEPRLVSLLRVALPGAPAPRGAALARQSVHTALLSHGAQVEALGDGSLVAVLRMERGAATDQAMLAARCALTLQERWPEARVAVASGLALFQGHVPTGPAVEQAEALLRHSEQEPAGARRALLDEVSAGLLGPGFQLSRSSSGSFLLQGERAEGDRTRPLWGRSMPFVGREQELALLEFTLAASAEEPVARAMLVTGPAGVGKARLLHEFLQRVEQREQPVLVLRGRGDPLGVGTSYGLLGQVLRRWCGLGEGAAGLEECREKLFQSMAPRMPGARAREAALFLGELCATSSAEEDSPALREARGDPRRMSTQVSQALVGFLQAECSRRPVLLVLEELHWSDAPTVKLMGEVLRELADQPLMLLALARPEVKELFPGPWTRLLQELSLRGLSQKASTRLVHEVLGPQVPPEVVARLVERSMGNVLFLEELLRGMAEGRGEETPGTVLAILQASLQRLGPVHRKVLQAASTFGRSFRVGAVKALLEGALSARELEDSLRQLVELDVVQPQPGGQLPEELEYRFRHALVRDAAHSLIRST